MRVATSVAILILGGAAYTAPADAAPYGEIRGGMNLPDERSGVGKDASAGYSADLAYKQKQGFGAEGGMRGILDTPFAIGLALDGFRTALESATVSGSGALAPPPPATEVEAPNGVEDTTSVSLSPDQVRNLGFNFDDRVTLLSANVFYELGDEEGLVIYAGVGFGVAAIGDADLRSGPLLHLGVRYPIDPIGYVSLRATRFQTDGLFDEAAGLDFEEFAFNGVTLAFGIEF